MNLKNYCKIIKDKVFFCLKFLFQPNLTKNKKMRNEV
jgi:hypothetical protein